MVGIVIDTGKLRKDLDQLHEDSQKLGRELDKKFKEIEVQTGMAIGALGLVVAQTLAELDARSEAIKGLKKRAANTYASLPRASISAELFGHFVRALEKEFSSKTS
jgi:hypothetical protein